MSSIISKCFFILCVLHAPFSFSQGNTSTSNSISVEEMRGFIEGKKTCGGTLPSNKITAPTLLVFVSTSMPKSSIEHLLHQVEKVGGCFGNERPYK